MTPQSNFMVLAPIRPERQGELRAMLETMNGAPGMAEPANALFPFGRFPRLHVARFVILDDTTLTDLPPDDPLREAPVYLAFLGDCDGSADAQLAEFVTLAGDGLRRIFGCCSNFSLNVDLLQWMRAQFHHARCAIRQLGWTNRRTDSRGAGSRMRHCANFSSSRPSALAQLPPRAVRDRLIECQRKNGPARTPPAPTPAGWLISDVANLIRFLWYCWCCRRSC